MKKLLLSATLLTITLSSIAQTQIPNGDFETWATFSGCSGVDSAAHFSTTDEQLYADTEICLPNTSVSKSTDSHTGSFALRMTPLPIVNILTTPPTTYFYGSYVSIADTVNGSQIAFTGRPTKLSGYYKLNVAGSDVFTIMVGTLISNAEDVLSYGEFSTSTSTTGYELFEITLDYDLLESTNPDSLFLSFSLADAQASGSPNSYVLIDDLVFEYPTTATTAYSTASPLNIFTTQKNINFSSEVSDVVIYNLVGSQELTQTTVAKSINAATLKSGLYVVTYKYNDNFYSKKVVIE